MLMIYILFAWLKQSKIKDRKHMAKFESLLKECVSTK